MAINVPLPSQKRPEDQQLGGILSSDDMLHPMAAHLREVEASLGAALVGMARPSTLVARLRRELEERERRREALEQEWLDAYRRYNNEYSPTIKARFKPGKSQIWVGLTQMKVHQAHAAIMDFLSNEIWDLEPEAIPNDAQINPMLVAAGWTLDTVREDIRNRTEAMKTEIENQLDRSDFDEGLDLCLLECCIAGTGVLRGPITMREEKPDWDIQIEATPTGMPNVVATPVQRAGYAPKVGYVSLFNVYPDLDAINVQEGGSIFEEMYLTRAQMIELATQSGFDTFSILRLLREHPKGNSNLEPHQLELRNMAGDSDPNYNTRYRVVVYYGPVTGEELALAGAEVDADDRPLHVTAAVWWCGQYVLRARQHRGPIPYYFVPFTRRVGFGPYGVGIPMLGRSSQDAINAGARIMLDNAAVASGPFIEANMSLLAPGEDPADLHGWKVFLSKFDPTGSTGNQRAINIYEIPAYTDQFMKIIDVFRQFLDEETFIPSLTGGLESDGQTDTATGMSILNSNANRSLKKVLRNVDHYLTEPLIEAMYHWNMRYNPDRSLIARMTVRAIGAGSIMAREVKSQRLGQFSQMWGNHPDFKSTEAMRKMAKAIDEDPDQLVATDEEKMGIVAPDSMAGSQEVALENPSLNPVTVG